MLTFRRLQLVLVAGLAAGCERTPVASAEVDPGRLLAASQGASTSETKEQSNASLRAIRGTGDAGFVPKFLSPNTIGNSAIFERDGKFVTIGGTGNTCCSLQVDGFSTVSPIVNIQQLDPSAPIKIEFAQAGFGHLADVGIARVGGPERFVILSSGGNPRKLPLSLAEGDGNVGIGKVDPHTKLDVVGDTRVSGDLTLGGNLRSPAIFEVDGRINIGGASPPAGRVQITDNFAGFGPTGQIVNIHQVDPTGDINVEFSQAGFGVLGNVGVIRRDGPERFVVLGAGRNLRNLSLTLAEDGGNVGIGTTNPGMKLDVVGNTRISGNLSVTGTKSSVATLADGRRVLLYAIESPQNWFEDFGAAQLTAGEAWVSLEGVFAETVNTGGGYHVFLTPNGNCKGLYVAEKRADGFVVRELGGGRSSVTFDYRIVAPRRGLETVRLQTLP